MQDGSCRLCKGSVMSPTFSLLSAFECRGMGPVAGHGDPISRPIIWMPSTVSDTVRLADEVVNTDGEPRARIPRRSLLRQLRPEGWQCVTGRSGAECGEAHSPRHTLPVRRPHRTSPTWAHKDQGEPVAAGYNTRGATTSDAGALARCLRGDSNLIRRQPHTAPIEQAA